jgi:hypothetical protein
VIPATSGSFGSRRKRRSPQAQALLENFAWIAAATAHRTGRDAQFSAPAATASSGQLVR